MKEVLYVSIILDNTFFILLLLTLPWLIILFWSLFWSCNFSSVQWEILFDHCRHAKWSCVIAGQSLYQSGKFFPSLSSSVKKKNTSCISSFRDMVLHGGSRATEWRVAFLLHPRVGENLRWVFMAENLKTSCSLLLLYHRTLFSDKY